MPGTVLDSGNTPGDKEWGGQWGAGTDLVWHFFMMSCAYVNYPKR